MAMPAARALPFAIALISAAALAYQLLLMRWLAIAHWQPFAVMIISLALLGHGASGTWLALWLEPAKRRFVRLRTVGFRLLLGHRCDRDRGWRAHRPRPDKCRAR